MSAQKPVELDELSTLASFLSVNEPEDADIVNRVTMELLERRARDTAVERLIGASQSVADNIKRWLETGFSATPEESKALYDNLVNALAAVRGGAPR